MRLSTNIDFQGNWAIWISNILHPIVLSPLTFLLLIGFSGAAWTTQIIWTAIACACCIIPFTFLGQHQDPLGLNERQQQRIPLLIGILCYTLGFLGLSAFDAPFLIQGLMFCYIVTTLIIISINPWWPVSIHTAGMGGSLMALTLQWGWLILPLYAFIPLVGAASVSLKKHTTAQVVGGALIGLLVTGILLKLIFQQWLFT